jgi:alpha-tubulin suppressor-like RCC1 family protein
MFYIRFAIYVKYISVIDKMSHIIENFEILSRLNDVFKQRIKILFVFENYDYIPSKADWVLEGYNVIMVTDDNKTYAFGNNTHNQLGFGHNRVVNEIQIVEELCDQQIIDFANGFCHCIARNSNGKVFCWGYNNWGLLGNGSEDNNYQKPKLNPYLDNEFVVDISCGAYHSLVLTNSGEVYAWGNNESGQIGNCCNEKQLKPIKVNGFNNERVVMISCGSSHSLALTECGHVYSWGRNKFGQLGIGTTSDSNEPKFVTITDEYYCDVFIEKISCGSAHNLLLSIDGYIYAFGRNASGELGNKKERNELKPIKIDNENNFIDILSHRSSKFYSSTALSIKGIYYIWGKLNEEIIRTPKPTKFESFFDIYANYIKINLKQ